MKKSHDHNKCLKTAIINAEAICQKAKTKLTPIRKMVLELIWKEHNPVKAYDLLSRLDTNKCSAKPPTIYRALDFLLEMGLIHKIETMNSFVGCHHPEISHFCQFAICESCGSLEEFCDESIADIIKNNAKKIGFKIKSQKLEIIGRCEKCS
jgi:Fur family zinc uptake transcriptional regulator